MKTQIENRSKVSIIIPTFNCEKTIGLCLQSVFQSEYDDFEVIVADDGSIDGTVDLLNEWDCQTIRLKTNQGPAVARNRGAQNVSGSLLFFLDADITIEPDTIGLIHQAFQDRPDVSAFFCSYQKDTPVASFYSKYKNLLHHYTHQNSLEEAATFCGGYGAIKKDIFLEFKGFDPAYRFLEDIELGYRLHQDNHHILLKKDIQLTHLKHYSFWGLVKSDVLGRAKPWTEMMLAKRIFKNDLNTHTENVFSVPIAFLILAGIPLPFIWPFTTWILFILTLCFLVLNRRFFLFILRVKGIVFLIKSIVFNWFSYLYSGVGLIMGVAAYLRRIITKRQIGGSPCC